MTRPILSIRSDVNSSSGIFERRGNPWVSPKERQSWGRDKPIVQSSAMAEMSMNERTRLIGRLKSKANAVMPDNPDLDQFSAGKAKPKSDKLSLRAGNSRDPAAIKRLSKIMNINRAIAKGRK